MPILDRFEKGCSKKMVSGVIFWRIYLIGMKKEMLNKMIFLGCMGDRFGALLGNPMARDGKQASPR